MKKTTIAGGYAICIGLLAASVFHIFSLNGKISSLEEKQKTIITQDKYDELFDKYSNVVNKQAEQTNKTMLLDAYAKTLECDAQYGAVGDGYHILVGNKDIDKIDGKTFGYIAANTDFKYFVFTFMSENGECASMVVNNTALNNGASGKTSSDNVTAPTNPPATNAPIPAFDKATVINQLVTKEYKWNYYRNQFSVGLVIKNNSSYNIRPNIQMIFKDIAGNTVGVSNGSTNYSFSGEPILEAGEELIYIFSNDIEFVTYEYTIDIEEEQKYESYLPFITYKVDMPKDKAIISFTNIGDKPLKFAKYTLLFMSGENIVHYGWGYASDNDSELKPGKTEYREESCRDAFDSVIVYITQ